MNRNKLTTDKNNGLQLAVAQIRTVLESARANIAKEINNTMLITYWEIGHIIVEQEQDGELKAKYGKRLLSELSKRLTRDLGRGFSRSNLYNMREFYSQYPISQTLSGKLSWSHYLDRRETNEKIIIHITYPL
jgi:hypothetical protein